MTETDSDRRRRIDPSITPIYPEAWLVGSLVLGWLGLRTLGAAAHALEELRALDAQTTPPTGK